MPLSSWDLREGGCSLGKEEHLQSPGLQMRQLSTADAEGQGLECWTFVSEETGLPEGGRPFLLPAEVPGCCLVPQWWPVAAYAIWCSPPSVHFLEEIQNIQLFNTAIAPRYLKGAVVCTGTS